MPTSPPAVSQNGIQRTPDPPPKYCQQFEDLCLTIFQHVWRCPTAQQNGRQGQPQQGTDIWGTDDGALVGVQCKGKDAGFGATLSKQELLDEVDKAKGFRPPLSHWILATTAPKDVRIEELAREIPASVGPVAPARHAPEDRDRRDAGSGLF
jgi:hypothetical protein